MEKKFQVFISSTYEDLKEERRIAIERVLDLNHIPIGMEAFAAGNDRQWDFIKKRIQDSDYYIVIIAERYGSIAHDGRSYTQMEYEYAIDCNIPVAAFLLGDEARKTWPSEKVEFEKKTEINRFREICKRRRVNFWNTPHELGANIVISLIDAIKTNPQVGWVRANNVPTTEILSEVARLSSEKRELQDKITSYESERKHLGIPTHTLHTLSNMRAASILDLTTLRRENADRIAPNANLIDFLKYFRLELAKGITKFDWAFHLSEALGLNFSAEEDREILIDTLDRLSIELISYDIIEEINMTNNTRMPPGGNSKYILTKTGKEILLYSAIQFAD